MLYFLYYIFIYFYFYKKTQKNMFVVIFKPVLFPIFFMKFD